MEPKKIALIAVAALTFVMLAASCGGNSWTSVSLYGYTASSGLWKYCSGSICASYSGKIPVVSKHSFSYILPLCLFN